MASITRCIITASVEGKGVYGVTVDTDENVYFSIGVADAAGLEEFDTVEAILVANDRADPPWKAIRARRLDDRDQELKPA